MQQRSASGLPRGSQTSLRQRARSVGQRGGLAVASSAKATPAPFAHLPSTPRNGKRRRSVGHALRCAFFVLSVLILCRCFVLGPGGVTSLNDMLADGSKSSSTANPFEALVSDHDVDFAAMAATQKSAFEPAPKRIRDEESLSRSRGRSRSQSRRRTLLARRHAGECATCDTSISGETGESCRSKIVELRRRCDEQQHELRLRQARIVTLQQSLKQTESKVSEQSAKLRTLQVSHESVAATRAEAQKKILELRRKLNAERVARVKLQRRLAALEAGEDVDLVAELRREICELRDQNATLQLRLDSQGQHSG
ncbi:MAG: hypothetical protein MHM6MM_002509 [Cercozoa sp. M6MM]